MFDNTISAALLALIAAVGVAAGGSLGRESPTPAAAGAAMQAALPVVRLPEVHVVGHRPTGLAAAHAMQVVQLPPVVVTGRRLRADVPLQLAGVN